MNERVTMQCNINSSISCGNVTSRPPSCLSERPTITIPSQGGALTIFRALKRTHEWKVYSHLAEERLLRLTVNHTH